MYLCIVGKNYRKQCKQSPPPCDAEPIVFDRGSPNVATCHKKGSNPAPLKTSPTALFAEHLENQTVKAIDGVQQ
jgi:hypothetical protein